MTPAYSPKNNINRISILIPVRNEAKYIRACLESIYAQDYPHRDQMEIIIAGGTSTDNTRTIVESIPNPGIPLYWVNNPAQIVPTGLNLAIQRAAGAIIIRIDGHTTIASDYVSQCVEALQRTGADNAGGRMDAIGNTPFGETVAAATSTPFGVGGSRFHYSDQEEWVDSVYLGAWRREVFEKIGLFDEELVRDQDDEFNYRLREYGGKILLSPKIKSIYTVRSSPKALWRQYYQYGCWKVRVLQKHPRQMSPRHFVPPAFTAALIGSVLLTLMLSSGWILLTLVAGSYLFANLSSSILTAGRKGWKHLPLLPITFAILHLSYGTGFLAGLVKFSNRWRDKQGNILGSHAARPEPVTQ
jgi:succinoglycan biosynthesis protein ExoA